MFLGLSGELVISVAYYPDKVPDLWDPAEEKRLTEAIFSLTG